ncbi:MAG: hypothetical protein ACYS5V_12400 [Planctomycetota bacterium]|jgi:hypothetical protein
MTDSPDKPADEAEARIERVGIPSLADLGHAHKRRKRTAPPPDDRHGVPAWPTVIGVLSIVMGASWLVRRNLPRAAWVLQRLPMAIRGNLSLPGGPGAWQVLYFVCGTAAAILAVVAGIWLLRRRRGAVGLHVLYAVAGLAGAAAGHWSDIAFNSRAPADVRRFVLFYLATSLISDAAYPVLVAAWFARKNVRRQWRHLRVRARPRPLSRSKEAWPAVLAAVAAALGVTGVLDCSGKIALDMMTMGRMVDAEIRLMWIMPPVVSVQLPLAALLIASAPLLARRRRAGAVCQVVFAIGAILLVVAGSVIGLALTRGGAAKLGDPFWAASCVLGMLGALTCPVFLLVWFARPEIRAQVRSWASEREAGEETEGLRDGNS